MANTVAEIQRFAAKFERITIKPIDGYGGKGIFFYTQGKEPDALLNKATHDGAHWVIAQEYLPAAKQGDKRILLVNGEPVPYALARFAGEGDFRGNLAKGGSSKGVPLSERDRWICSQVAPELKKRGILFSGLDVIGDWLSEVNVTSPTGIRELEEEFGLNIAGLLFDSIEETLA